jgi:hypothetical protein
MAKIPDDLMARLHNTNERFHRARQALDRLEDWDPKGPTPVAIELRAAQLEWEQITSEIHQHLHADPGMAR